MNRIKRNKLIGNGVIFGTVVALGGIIAIGKKIRNNKIQKLLESEKYCTGEIRKFGTLYLDNEKQKKPVDFLGFEDIPSYLGQKIQIRDTDKNDENKLSWVEINDNDKKLLICDRNILKEVSWNELNDQNLIFGKVVILEEKKYILRLLTGYNVDNGYISNEWDKYIVNIDKILDLPISTDYDKDNSLKEDDEENNSLWNWHNFSSLTHNEHLKDQKFCIIRGFYSTKYSNQSNKSLKYETVGYRPVLELIK